jgi:hypothetical protein
MAVVAGVVFFRVRALLSGNDVATQRSFFHDGGPAPAAFLESCRAYSSPAIFAARTPSASLNKPSTKASI